MRTILLFLGSGAFTFSLLLGGTWACPDVLDNFGLNFSDLPALLKVIEEEKEKENDLSTRTKEIFARMDAKDQIARDMLAGHLTLFQAAARMRILPGLDDELWDIVLCQQPGASSDERLCWYTIYWAGLVVVNESLPPSVGADVVARLKEELRHKVQHGEVHVP